jgi:transposase
MVAFTAAITPLRRDSTGGASMPASTYFEVGQIVVMHNLSAHKHARVRELIEQRGCELVHLLPYSPDLNPREEVFLKVKGLLRRVGVLTPEALIQEAMGQALSAVTARDSRGFPAHCSYRSMGQAL